MAHIYNMPSTPPNRHDIVTSNSGNRQELVENYHPYSSDTNFHLSSSLIRELPTPKPPRRLTYSSMMYPLPDSIYQVIRLAIQDKKNNVK